MLVVLIIMCSAWAIAVAIKTFVIKDAGTILSIFIAILLASAAAILQVFIVATLNENTNISPDPMSYIRNAFLTFCILIYVVYTTVRRAPISSSTESSKNDQIYAQAWKELETETHEIGLWSKVFSESNGDEAIAKAKYIELRVPQLIAEEKLEKERENQKRCPYCNTEVKLSQSVCSSCNKILPWRA